MTSQVTVVLTLKDRALWTPFFIRYSLDPRLDYLVLDGGQTSQEHFFKPIAGNSRLRYLRFAADRGAADYLDKIRAGLSSITTPYVLMADNDDIVLAEGVLEAARCLDASTSSSLAGHSILGFHIDRDMHRSSFPFVYSNHGHLRSGSATSRISRYGAHHANIWNLVSRTHEMLSATRSIQELEIDDFHQIEWFFGEIMLSNGDVVSTRVPHYMRLENQWNRAIDELPGKGIEISSEKWAHDYAIAIAQLSTHLEFAQCSIFLRQRLLTGTTYYSISTRLALRARNLIAAIRFLSPRVCIWLASRGLVIPISAFPSPAPQTRRESRG